MLWFLLAVIAVLSLALGFNLAALADQRRKNDRLERDQRIAQLETDLSMNLPAITSGVQDASPLVRLLAVVVGIWAADRRSRHRW